VTVQPVIAAEPAVTFTSPWKPPGHWLVLVYVAVQARVPAGPVVAGPVVVGGAVVGGRVVGGVVVGGAVVVTPPKFTSLQRKYAWSAWAASQIAKTMCRPVRPGALIGTEYVTPLSTGSVSTVPALAGIGPVSFSSSRLPQPSGWVSGLKPCRVT
jgi:hypothetical protein